MLILNRTKASQDHAVIDECSLNRQQILIITGPKFVLSLNSNSSHKSYAVVQKSIPLNNLKPEIV